MEKRYIALVCALLVAVSVMVQPISAEASSNEMTVYLEEDSINYLAYYRKTDGTAVEIQRGDTDLTKPLTMYIGSVEDVETVYYSLTIRLPLTQAQLDRIASASSVRILVTPTAIVSGNSVYSFYSWRNGTSYSGTTAWDSQIVYKYKKADNTGESMALIDVLSGEGTSGMVQNEGYDKMTDELNNKSLTALAVAFSNRYYPDENSFVGATARLNSCGIKIILTYDTADEAEKSEIINISNAVGNIASSIDSAAGAITGNQGIMIEQNNTMIQQNQTILEKIQAGFESIGDSVEQGVTNAVNKLFVPDQADIEAFMTNMQAIEEEHLAPIAQVRRSIEYIEESLLDPDFNAQISGELAPIGGYLNRIQGDGVFIFPSYELKLPEGNYTLWEEQVVDVGATLEDMKLEWIPTVTKAICSALFTWRFLIMVLLWLEKMTDNPTFGQWAGMLRTFDMDFKVGA